MLCRNGCRLHYCGKVPERKRIRTTSLLSQSAPHSSFLSVWLSGCLFSSFSHKHTLSLLFHLTLQCNQEQYDSWGENPDETETLKTALIGTGYQKLGKGGRGKKKKEKKKKK
ncbi:hypothetical protein BO82DRAFT_124043 [Aspergillus uvarum CBS 121591]|uniref:Uncharacterized protein n=1 Tax=Aspergillus uvarum CBS 121591 TaxID=1448315 RepID=A0A319C1D5_9EURO|nr:hypothetical protein BO82DRAFT_124043 [Aspergillus uvarum CBS 121591]PYH79826.1 hypothetical protein BO82DRAFT_124043 [Aspergillus uvarum CBS 121591]